SSFSVGFLHENLLENDQFYKEHLGKRVIKNFSSKNISEGKGFLSYVYRCVFTFNDCPDEYSVILKVPTRQCLDEAQNKADNFDFDLNDESFERLHEYESYFYNTIAPLLDIKLPKVYKTMPWIINQKEGCILMEDL
uniref:Uncharacterized protein n=1 Tax=Panagrolaimus sp. JU765 TaxID=591449 RepID=A0AC34Q3H8_9BILA